MRRRPRRALDDEPPHRLPQLQPRRRARLMRERHDRAHVRELRPATRDPPPTTSGHGARCTDSGPSNTRFRHRCSVRNGSTGASTRNVCTNAYQSVPSAAASPSQNRDRVRRMYQFDRSSTIRLEVADHVDRQPRLVPARRIRDERMRPLDEPPVERPQLARRLERRPRRPEPLDVRVQHEERHGVPQRQQLALDLIRRAKTEQQVPVRRLRAVLPAHHVGTHQLERVVGGDRVPPRPVHLAAGLVEHLLVAEHVAGTARAPSSTTDMNSCE